MSYYANIVKNDFRYVIIKFRRGQNAKLKFYPSAFSFLCGPQINELCMS